MASPTSRSRRSARQTLTAAEYRHLLDLVNVIVWRADARTFQTTFASSQAEQILGYPLASWTTVPNFWVEHLHPEDRQRVLELSSAAIEDRRSHDFEYRMIAADGRTVWLRNIVTVVVEGKKAVELIGVTTDITARKEMEQEAARLRDQLTRLTRVTALGELATALAHELNQPLGAITSNAETADLLLQRGSLARAELECTIADIRRDAYRAGAIVNSVQALVKHESTTKEPVRLSDVVTSVTAMLKSLVTSHGIEMVIEIPHGLPSVTGNVIELQQLFYNLILNAVDALSSVDRGRRRITIAARSGARRRVDVSVTDTGPGITASMLPHIFEPFATTKVGGMGIGLAMCRRIVEALGGEIHAENSPQGGATLRFTLQAAARRGVAA